MNDIKQPLAPMEDLLLTRAQLAARWSSSIKTIQRRELDGLRVTRVGHAVRYRLSDVLKFEAAG